MNKSYKPTISNLPILISEILTALNEGKALKVDIKLDAIGKWSMSRLWYSWMASTADYMAARGCVMPTLILEDGKWLGERKFNSNDAHELFTISYLGQDESGNRYSWGKSKESDKPQADISLRVYAMQSHKVYMDERGIKYMNPRDSEFDKLMKHYENI